MTEIDLTSSKPAHGHVKHQEPAQPDHLSFCMSTLEILAGMFAKCHFTEPLQSSSQRRAAPKSLLMNSGWEQQQRRRTRVSSGIRDRRSSMSKKAWGWEKMHNLSHQRSATIPKPNRGSLPRPGLLSFWPPRKWRWAPLLVLSALWGWSSALNGLGEAAFSPVSHSLFILLHLWKCQHLSLFWQICDQTQNRRRFLPTISC